MQHAWSITVGGTSSFYRAQRLMGRNVDVPNEILTLNPKSDLVKRLGERLKTADKDSLSRRQ